MIAALLLFAAIITERNNYIALPPNYATFEGSPSTPGIASQWIPYGTYTDGVGSTEYLRVTSNLTGVVASAFDGYLERSGAAMIGLTDWPERDTRVFTLPATNGADSASVLTNNNTRRIIDIFNRFKFFNYQLYSPEIYSVDVSFGERGGMIEDSFAFPVEDSESIYDEYGHFVGTRYYQYNDGLATYFGGRYLDALLGGASLEPPIGNEWTTNLPFQVAASNDWVTVWPVYGALTNDIHILRETELTNEVYELTYPRRTIESWMYGNAAIWDDDTRVRLWGDDVYGEKGDGTGKDLVAALEAMPINHTIEDVLKIDPGWVYSPTNQDDFAHWRNGTTRLDWKRLGMLCQLERHMEQTYYHRNGAGDGQGEDFLPYVFATAEGGISWSSQIEVALPADTNDTAEIDMSEVSWQGESTNTMSVITNDTGWTFPLARAGAPRVGGRVVGGSGEEPLYLDADMLKEAIQEAIRDTGEAAYTNLVMITNYVASVVETNETQIVGHDVYSIMEYPSNQYVVVAGPEFAGMEQGPITTNVVAAADPVAPDFPGLTNIVRLVNSGLATNTVDYSEYHMIRESWAVTNNVAATNYVVMVDHAEVTSNCFTAVEQGSTTNVIYAWTNIYDSVEGESWSERIYSESTIVDTIGIAGPMDDRVVITNSYSLDYNMFVTNVTENFDPEIDYWIATTTNLVAITNYLDRAAVTNYMEHTFNFAASLDFEGSTMPPGVLLRFADVTLEDSSVTIGLVDFGIMVDYEPASTSLVVDLYLGVDKSANGLWTHSGADIVNSTIQRFGRPGPARTNLWGLGYIARQTWPTLDVMLSAKGNVAEQYMSGVGSGTAARRKMTWQRLRNSNGSQRLFRMNPQCQEESSLSLSDINRFNMLHDLNVAVHDRFRSEAGNVVVEDIEGRAMVQQGDINSIMTQLNQTNATVGLVITTLPDSLRELYGDITAHFFATVETYGDEVQDVYDLILYVEGPYDSQTFGPDTRLSVGTAHWAVDELTIAGPTNSTAVAVDAHQNQMIKTLWRFKNLRDPNL